jgi:hypothetical protein
MAVTKSANINWVKDIYIEQNLRYKMIRFSLTRDYMMSDFALNKRRFSWVYGKRTTLYQNHQFNIEKPIAFIRRR